MQTKTAFLQPETTLNAPHRKRPEHRRSHKVTKKIAEAEQIFTPDVVQAWDSHGRISVVTIFGLVLVFLSMIQSARSSWQDQSGFIGRCGRV